VSATDKDRPVPDSAFIQSSDAWLDREGERAGIVTSSRVRLARNLPDVTFPMRAHAEDLQAVAEAVGAALSNCPASRDFRLMEVARLDPLARTFLRENHLISAEFEKGGGHRLLAIATQLDLGVMVNEEDHLRLYALRSGFSLRAVLEAVVALDQALERHIAYAVSPQFGYLAACPTNTGTGMRASVMLHLPGLVMTQRIQEITDYIPDYGLAVRGFYGENSDFIGDFFQISNEQTLGKSENQIVEDLTGVVDEIARKEVEARRFLFEEKANTLEDVVWRSWALLTNARTMNSSEAAKLLSKLRLGIDRNLFPGLTHARLNKLFVLMQPGHLQFKTGQGADTESRDAIRAQLLRKELHAGNGSSS